MTDKDPDTSRDDKTSEPLQVRFSLPQLAGGALAAATAALIGSRLGVAGTIFGAAVASLVGGVAGTLYSAGLDRTHRRVTEAIRRGYERVLDADGVETQVLPAVDATAELPAVGDGAAGTERNRPHSVPGSDQDAVEETAVDLQPVPSAEPDRSSRRRKILVAMGLSIAAIFVVTMLVITAVELALGSSLDGSSTTTIGGARRPTATATTAKPTRSPSASESQTTSAPASPTPEPTPSASEETSVEPSPSAVPPTPAATSS